MRHENTLIIGAGPIGLACALSAQKRDIDPLVIDAGAIANSIVHYPIGMGFFTTPELLEIGDHPFPCAGQKPTREEALKYYRGVVRTSGLRVQTFTTLETAEPVSGGLLCTIHTESGTEQIQCARLVLATGYYDNPNRLGVPGESLPHVHAYFDEAHRHCGLDVVVIGGRNSAAEAALELFRAGARVTLVYRGTTFRPSIKYWVKPDLENRIAAGEIRARLGATVVRIEPDAVVIRSADQGEERVPADRVFTLIGFHPDFALFERLGIACDAATQRPVINPDTHETNVPGIYLAGSIIGGRETSQIFIENGRFDGEKIFGGGK